MISFFYKNRKYHFDAGHYASNDRLYLSMVDSNTYESYAEITCNFEELDHEPYNFLAFDTNIFCDSIRIFHELNLIRDFCYHISSCFCYYPVFSIDIDLLQKYTKGSVYNEKLINYVENRSKR